MGIHLLRDHPQCLIWGSILSLLCAWGSLPFVVSLARDLVPKHIPTHPNPFCCVLLSIVNYGRSVLLVFRLFSELVTQI